jgi:hypothetical protein
MVARSLPFDGNWLAKVERPGTGGRARNDRDIVLISLVRREIVGDTANIERSVRHELEKLETQRT